MTTRGADREKLMAKTLVLVALRAATLLIPWRGWSSSAEGDSPGRESICQPKLHLQPNGPFAVIGFCEDALADHIGIIYYESMMQPTSGAWSLTDRFWQQQKWAADVTSFAWGPDGNTLFVATSEIYGSGDIFMLQLRERKTHMIASKTVFQSPRRGTRDTRSEASTPSAGTYFTDLVTVGIHFPSREGEDLVVSAKKSADTTGHARLRRERLRDLDFGPHWP